jgi:anhydro-N-acetylmuramic acid kinase
MFHSNEKNRVLVNIGGIANVTFLYKDEPQKTYGFDTGPGNTLMDAWIRKHQSVNFD